MPVNPFSEKTSQLAWTYHNLKQQWGYVTQTINQMKKMDSREKKRINGGRTLNV